ncbi:MAG: polysaccharide deacetylase family protein, partial [Lachnospiraceae bacterium]|nr:polysaccharide deacetylase family protein [Lachnospiraceae bacterium]
MRKMMTAILLFDLMAGLLFLGFYGMRSRAVVTDSSIVRMEGEERLEEADVKKIAITFDDGPHPSYTAQLLDGLKERGIHATFFVTGEHAE